MVTSIDGFGGGGMAQVGRTAQLGATISATGTPPDSSSTTDTIPSIGDDENAVETSGSATATWQQAAESYGPAENGEDEFLSLRSDPPATNEASDQQAGTDQADTASQNPVTLASGLEAAQQGKEVGEKVKKGFEVGKDLSKTLKGAESELGKDSPKDEPESGGGFGEHVGGGLTVVKGVTSAASLLGDETKTVAAVQKQDFGQAAQYQLKADRDGASAVDGVDTAAKVAKSAPGQAGRIAKTLEEGLGKTIGKDGDVAKLALGGKEVSLGAKAVPIIGLAAAGVDATYRVTDMARNWGHMSTATRVSNVASLVSDVATVAAVVTPPPVDAIAAGVAVGAGLISWGTSFLGGG